MKKFSRFSKKFKSISKIIVKFYPSLKNDLELIQNNKTPEEFLSSNLVISLIVSLFFFFFISVYFYLHEGVLFFEKIFLLLFYSIAIQIFLFFILNLRPRIESNKKMKLFERNLPVFIRQLYVRVTAGMSLYASIENISEKDYGGASSLARRIVAHVRGGLNEVEALEAVSKEIPLEKLNKLFWQIINSVKSGANISETLNSMVIDLEKEQGIMIEEFGSKLTPLTMMYLLLTIIFPSLGTAFVIIISSLFGTIMNEKILWMFPIYIIIINFIFFNLVKRIKPNVEM